MKSVPEAFKLSSLFIVCITLIILSITGGFGYYHLQDRKLMEKGVSEAINKGIDPMSVRCSYAPETDTVCVAFAYSKQSKVIPIEPPTSLKK